MSMPLLLKDIKNVYFNGHYEYEDRNDGHKIKFMLLAIKTFKWMNMQQTV